MNSVRYLEKQSLPPFETKRSMAKICPCGKSNKDGKFVPFKGFTDKGYCHSCGDKFLPEFKKADFTQKERFLFPNTKGKETRKRETAPISFLPIELLEKTLTRYEDNYFAQFLITRFGKMVAEDLLCKFYVGTSKKYPGANVFFQIDINGELRQAKIMVYDPNTGRRRQDIPPYQIARQILGYEANIQPCFFNEVSLTLFPDKPVAICESEKSAIIGHVFMNQFCWLATGGKNGVKWTEYEVCKVLKNRTIILFPDILAFDNWKEVSETIKTKIPCKILVSELLEKNATPEQREKKLDIADFLLMNIDSTGLALNDPGYPITFDYIIY